MYFRCRKNVLNTSFQQKLAPRPCRLAVLLTYNEFKAAGQSDIEVSVLASINITLK